MRMMAMKVTGDEVDDGDDDGTGDGVESDGDEGDDDAGVRLL